MNRTNQFIFFILISILINFSFTYIAQAIVIPQKVEINSSKNKFLGEWNMQTIVTTSSCPYIFVGSTTESKLEIKPESDNTSGKYLLKALWKGGKWSKSTGTIKLLNDNEAITERITKFKTNDKNNWKAILIDHLKLDENNTMQSESIVIQYKNGLLVGEYKTFSILTKEE